MSDIQSATLQERVQIGEMIQDVKAKANFYALTQQQHPTDQFAPIRELLELANGLQAAAQLAPDALVHPFEVVRTYAAKRYLQAQKVKEPQTIEVESLTK